MLPGDEQRETFTDTFVNFDHACNFVSRREFQRKLYSKVLLLKIVQGDIMGLVNVAETYMAIEARIPASAVDHRIAGRERLIAPLNIRSSAAVSQPMVARVISEHIDPPVGSPDASAWSCLHLYLLKHILNQGKENR
ncbi:MAG: hypothetical protein M1138_07050 [Candidatus Thermoplasmatota archaeon]|nr:hypothetical protein [Candidatus Thermoplasmatota archaeon]